MTDPKLDHEMRKLGAAAPLEVSGEASEPKGTPEGEYGANVKQPEPTYPATSSSRIPVSTVNPVAEAELLSYIEELERDKLSKPATPSVSSAPPRSDSLDEKANAKLLLDAENILTWESSGDDPLMFGHLRRFAKAVIALLSRLEATKRDLEMQAEKIQDMERIIMQGDTLALKQNAALRSENARMAEVEKWARAVVEGWPLKASLAQALRDLDAARASRTQSPDANREEK